MYFNASGQAFYVSKLLKTSHQKSQQHTIEFKVYSHDVTLCLVAFIKLYLDKKATVRHNVNVFISFLTPDTPGSSKTFARWVSDTLQKMRIHTKTFKIHSLGSTLASNAFSGGLSLTKTAKAVGWTNVRTFGRFYNKSVIILNNNCGNFYGQNVCKFMHIFRYYVLRIGICKMYGY